MKDAILILLTIILVNASYALDYYAGLYMSVIIVLFFLPAVLNKEGWKKFIELLNQ